MTRDLLVVGGGVIGLSCAWRAALDGWSVTVLDPAPDSGASRVAGGMLAPLSEAWPGEEDLLALGVEAVARWPGFAAELSEAAGRPAGLRTDGTLMVATGSGDRAELETIAAHLDQMGRRVERLSGRELRRREPGLGPDVRGGLSIPDDLSVDNRMLLAALWEAADRSGVRFDARSVAAVLDDGAAVIGVRCVDGAELFASTVLVAAGAHSASLHPVLAGLVRPVKGEILRLRQRPGTLPPPTRTIRGLVDGRPVYLVPRDNGGLVVGATQVETGFDTEVTVGGVRDLLRDAERVLPAIGEYALCESAAGLRPASPDNLPLIGTCGPAGLIVATGHHRNGILLTPITADAVRALLRGEPVPDVVVPASPLRWMSDRHRTERGEAARTSAASADASRSEGAARAGVD